MTSFVDDPLSFEQKIHVNISSDELNPKVSDGSFFSLMKTMDDIKFKRFCSFFNRLISNVKFTRSLSEYFATDDMLEPALSLIAEAIRSGPDLGSILRGGSFSARSLTYRNSFLQWSWPNTEDLSILTLLPKSEIGQKFSSKLIKNQIGVQIRILFRFSRVRKM